MVGWKSFSGNDFLGRWTSKKFDIELSDICPELGWYVLRYDYEYYKSMPNKIPDIELVLKSNPDMWEDQFKVYVKFENDRLTMMCESDVPDYVNDDLVYIVMGELECNKYLRSVLDTWDSVAGSRGLDNFIARSRIKDLSSNINEISARLPGYLTGGITYNYSKP